MSDRRAARSVRVCGDRPHAAAHQSRRDERTGSVRRDQSAALPNRTRASPDSTACVSTMSSFVSGSIGTSSIPMRASGKAEIRAGTSSISRARPPHFDRTASRGRRRKVCPVVSSRGAGRRERHRARRCARRVVGRSRDDRSRAPDARQAAAAVRLLLEAARSRRTARCACGRNDRR